MRYSDFSESGAKPVQSILKEVKQSECCNQKIKKGITVNVDIFVYFLKWAFSHVLKFAFSVHLSLYDGINVIFTVYIFSRTFKKYELRDNMYLPKMSTFKVTT